MLCRRAGTQSRIGFPLHHQVHPQLELPRSHHNAFVYVQLPGVLGHFWLHRCPRNEMALLATIDPKRWWCCCRPDPMYNRSAGAGDSCQATEDDPSPSTPLLMNSTGPNPPGPFTSQPGGSIGVITHVGISPCEMVKACRESLGQGARLRKWGDQHRMRDLPNAVHLARRDRVEPKRVHG